MIKYDACYDIYQVCPQVNPYKGDSECVFVVLRSHHGDASCVQ